MVWVVNAESFKENFSLRSKVTIAFRQLERETASIVSSIQKEIDEQKETDKKEIAKIDEQLRNLSWKVEDRKQQLDKLKIHEQEIEKLSETIILEWKEDRLRWRPELRDFLSRIGNSFRETILNKENIIRKLVAEEKTHIDILNSISNLETIEIDGINFKVITYSQITNENLHRVRTIKKSTRNTFFPQINKIDSRDSLFQLKYTQEEFIFVIDPTETITSHQEKAAKLQAQIEEGRKELERATTDFKTHLGDFIQERRSELEHVLDTLSQDHTDAMNQKELILSLQKIRMRRTESENDQFKTEIQSTSRKKRFEIMKTNKGTYTFVWKHERKSWQSAYRPTYFDCGNGILFERVDENEFHKLTSEKFFKKFLVPS